MNFQALIRGDMLLMFSTLVHHLRPGSAKPAKSKFFARAGLLLHDSERGGALVEMAIALPVMMLLITAMVSFGMLLSSYLMVSHAVDVGARNLALSRGATTNPCADAVAVIQGSAPTAAFSSLNYTFKIGSATFSGSSTGFSGTSSADCSQLGVSDMVAGDTAAVSVTYPFQLMVYGWSSKTINATVSTTEVIQ
jgi:Flp pilus assembly protein TadG